MEQNWFSGDPKQHFGRSKANPCDEPRKHMSETTFFCLSSSWLLRELLGYHSECWINFGKHQQHFLKERLQKKNKCDKKRLIENWRLFSLLDITWFTYQNILVSCLTDIALGNLGKKKTKYYVTMWLIPIWRLEVIVS